LDYPEMGLNRASNFRILRCIEKEENLKPSQEQERGLERGSP